MNLQTSTKMNVLAIGSHPDDIEFGCGGTLAKLVSKGHDVFMMVLSKGEVGGEANTREREQMRSAKVVKAKDVFWGNFHDTRIPFYGTVIQEIEKVVRQVKPSFVFVHYGRDTHQDHRHVSESTVVATRNVRNVMFYEGPTTIGFEPNVFVGVEHTIKKKMKCLSCHNSQIMRTNILCNSIIDIAMATAVFRGTQCRSTHAEAFSSLRMFILP